MHLRWGSKELRDHERPGKASSPPPQFPAPAPAAHRSEGAHVQTHTLLCTCACVRPTDAWLPLSPGLTGSRKLCAVLGVSPPTSALGSPRPSLLSSLAVPESCSTRVRFAVPESLALELIKTKLVVVSGLPVGSRRSMPHTHVGEAGSPEGRTQRTPESILPEDIALTSVLQRLCYAAFLGLDGSAWAHLPLAIQAECPFLPVSRPDSLESSRNTSSESSPLNLKGRSALASVHFSLYLGLWFWAHLFLYFKQTHRLLCCLTRLHVWSTSCGLRPRPGCLSESLYPRPAPGRPGPAPLL